MGLPGPICKIFRKIDCDRNLGILLSYDYFVTQSTLSMDNIRDRLEDISEIRSLMERQSKFLSLSGLSGISAGICGLLGAGFAYWYIEFIFMDSYNGGDFGALRRALLLDAVLVLISALGLAYFFSRRMASRKGLPMWNKTARRTLFDLLIPMLAGGAFCLVQIYQGYYAFIGPTTLLFYGLALLNASRNTLPEIRYLAISEIVLGLLCAIWESQSLLFWGIGFGILHIVYGAVMYFKYER